MANCFICKSELKFLNTPVFGAGKILSGEEMCNSCYNKVCQKHKPTTIKTLSLNDLQNFVTEKVSDKKTVELNFDAVPIEKLLNSIQNLDKISEIEIWDTQASLQRKTIIEFTEKLVFAKNQIDEEIKSSIGNNPIKNFFTKSKITSRNDSFLSQYENISKTLEYYNNQLEYWINLSPNSLEEINEMKAELKEKKQLFSIRKKELNLYKKQAWTNYRQNSAYVEFSYPKLRHIYRGLNIKEREKNLNPYDIELDNITLQLIEIEKLILWLNKFM